MVLLILAGDENVAGFDNEGVFGSFDIVEVVGVMFLDNEETFEFEFITKFESLENIFVEILLLLPL